MKPLFTIFLIVGLVSFVFGQKESDQSESFWWQNVGSIEVPRGFTKEYYNYREGSIFTLKYEDGSFIRLHKGGLMRLPFFQEGEEFEVEETKDFDDWIWRCGKRKNTELYWCEINFKRSRDLIFLPNLSFADVKKEKLELFKAALKSFKCVLCENKKNRVKI